MSFFRSVQSAVLPALVCLFLLTGEAGAHALTGRVVSAFLPAGGNTAALVAVSFTYSDGTPAAYVQAEIFAPGDEKAEYQNGRTDQNGVIAFAPNRNGTWRVTAFDTSGHKADFSVPVALGAGEENAEPAVPAAAPVSALDTPLRAVLGVSLLCNLWLLLGLWKRRSPKRQV